MDFTERVVAIVRGIPEGKTLSYGEVAARAGSPRAARAVGVVMKNNTDKRVPCHRVIRANGTLGGYNGLRGEKATLLRNEGALTSSQ
ncbi:6-O-methylguanine DNA methyltransferase [Candidatus Kaiserbacteria bacterium CG10_big_fil_rev_8_21_14_0_10_49_17]|uniref:6-O-methylguanine DNA methyltransferase n=1 Tax=Candidatus Kaiserbacteria bacterium CG10_big_fil_rev_8_21_14_0_10_49_17 TaxID=1974609 RepID=A0A2M6WF28_9BACT|nr:MAG: 6-O-methylguanine DNA methyltransferase [Candidatus Kaiserbacteria bacterium CG10_big_fil_rev_8_21_14_0_10_49_17]